ncbi:TetR family transcriptional regulator [Isoptericola sp. CG 20/1183]|uniref:TetR family transcriptional regulator n=1 Tax=Isoptericola halotolerans TaxID=300560 RepID=A0ABX5EAG9_9MICO|nr:MULTISPECIES: TetR/AcrR family transcriptional regulator [Isoptericola]PRZ03227.1 TetR family transcriptional regulator [Isoptericola sp. CG 20/1183]PRZ03561.1 TetR family transcriptional regulator [Isoptericola halotolerans]
MAARRRAEVGSSRRSPLDRSRIVAAAVTLADAEGVAGVTMRAVAAGLGVEAMSLYNHVRNRDDLLDGMVDLVFAEIELPTAGAGWYQAMRKRAESARAVLRRHPWAVGLLDSRSAPGPATLRHHDAVLGVLRGAGFSVAGAARAFSVIDSYLYGFVLQEVSLPFRSSEELGEVAGGILGGLDAGAYPHLVEITTEHALRPGYDYADEFDAGLALILGALEPDERGEG